MESFKRFLLLFYCFLTALSADLYPAAATGPTAIQVKKKVLCPTPPGIMLHSADGVYGMQWLVRTIEKHKLQTMTYRQVSDLWFKGLCPPGNIILVSLDDLGSNWLRKEFKDMIQVFTDKGYVLTLGVVTGTQDDPQNLDIWNYLRGLETLGIEVASHSARHSLLGDLTEDDIRLESQESYYILCEQLGHCPVTFILPFGRGAESPLVLEVLKESYLNVVSILAPKLYGNLPLLYKRIPLVQQENNPSEPKLGAPYFIEMPLAIHPLEQRKDPNRMEIR